jgi:hypothetical protein
LALWPLALTAIWIIAVMTAGRVAGSEDTQMWMTAAYSVGLGFAVGRARMALLPLIWVGVQLVELSSDSGELYLVLFSTIAAGLGAALCIWGGVGLSKLVSLPPMNRAWVAICSCEALLTIVLLAPAGDLSSDRHHAKPIATRPAQGPILELPGSYAGIPIGYPREAVKRKHGWPLLTLRTPVMNEENEPFYDPSWKGDSELKYRDARFDFEHMKVVRIAVYGRGGRTSRGVKIGDRLGRARKTYGARCWPDRRIGKFISKARCEVKLGPDRYLYFGEDPIKLIIVATHSFGDAPY